MDRFRDKYRISSARLQNYDYSSNGYYFITICTKNREYFFGEIVDNKMQLSKIGRITEKFWLEIPKHFPFVKLDEFVVMPNHVHGIIIINKTIVKTIVETRHCLVSTGIDRFQNQGKNTISSIVGSYKSICTKTINQLQNKIIFGWQPRFYDHIIRNEKSFYRIREYIRNNPENWKNDILVETRHCLVSTHN